MKKRKQNRGKDGNYKYVTGNFKPLTWKTATDIRRNFRRL